MVFLTLAACASDPVMRDGIMVNDPYEGANRRIHAFNKGVDARLVAPVARLASGGGESRGNAQQMRPADLVANVGANLSLPGKVVNHLLQGRPGPAIRNGFRFAVNSTLGIAGLFDPAGSDFGLDEVDTDFGQTLARWGAPEGAYLELPVLGPSTQRDAAGRVVDIVLDPWNHVLTGRQAVGVLGLRAAGKAADRARFGDTVEGVLQGSADSYAQTRLIWLMHRRHELGEEGNAFDPYDAIEDDDAVIDPYEE
ncbi:VacJ family lipoprotein [Paracoccus siganidrum]|uniref:VacJ family lipoprotein n=2 Tax=Paracoccus siganidrum TaxID=1276757 RepID=A0A419A917_9RHOB|nr:VacJ family lipoprotein [Paracoccus siganidrum]RMC38825.1 VacJ family lipoprotein [Paracoccus siganidrum]